MADGKIKGRSSKKPNLRVFIPTVNSLDQKSLTTNSIVKRKSSVDGYSATTPKSVHTIIKSAAPERRSMNTILSLMDTLLLEINGDLNEKIEYVCQELSAIPELKNGFNGIGFSQGGLFLRGLVQKCDSIKMVNLMTFGSPHAGVADIPNCEEESANCSLMRSIVKTGVYWSWIQSSVVQAQYYKDWKNLDKYLESNIFLPDLNQELEDINPDYTSKMKSLKRLVLIKFEQDHMIVPKETAWFGFYDEKGQVVDLKNQEWYKSNKLGLKDMDSQGKLYFVSLPGEHMKFDIQDLKALIEEYFLSVNLLNIFK
ncbi:hypothetical protein HDV04_005814 [Boothiomyces sp. JEL0838]|nr:hypothetical protein HDV04_005814 [Boothiomyces sp. JEL0838]